MRYTDLLRVTVLINAASATALASATLAAAFGEADSTLLYVSAGWWALAAGVGTWLGYGAGPTRAIEGLLADARAATSMPALEPGSIIVNRLWPVALLTLVAGGLSFLFPQATSVATGYALLVALAWRRQGAAVQAIEERDGAQFHVERSSPFKPIQLIRTAGLRRFETS